jgi:hypothetical protein
VAGQSHGRFCALGADVEQHRRAPGSGGHGRLVQRAALVIVQLGALARRPADEEALHALVEQEVDQ